MQSVRFAAILALLLVSDIEAELNFGWSNSGDMPHTMAAYLAQVNAEMDRSQTAYTFLAQTQEETGVVRSGQAVDSSRTTFVFTSKFEDLNPAQNEYIDTLYDADTFSQRLDPTYIEGEYTVAQDLSSEELGHGITGQLSSTAFKFIEGIEIFDRELVIVGAKTQLNSSCVLYGNPSVSTRWSFSTPFFGGWVAKRLGWTVRNQVEALRFRLRAENIFPSGDRVCKFTVDGIQKVQVDHMITTQIGGLVGPIYNLGLFDASQRDAYLTEAQRLETAIKGERRLSSSHGKSLLLV